MKRNNYIKSIAALFALAIIVFGAASAADAQAQFRKGYDFNGDGKADVALFSVNLTARKSSFYIANSPNDQLRAVQWGANDLPVAGDFDGDGRGDFAVIRGESGGYAWYILNSQATAFRRVVFGNSTGSYDDVPVPADYDGDGKDDIAVARRTTGSSTFTYYWLRSSDGQFGSRTVTRDTANVECRPTVPGDYNGDGKADFVVRCRQTANNQQYFNITDNAANTTQRVNWGIFTAYTNNGTNIFFEGDVFAPGDYDGDGKTDIAVVRSVPDDANNISSKLVWYVRRSSTGALQAQQYGGHNYNLGFVDSPTPADYDGDGKTDFSVSRDSDYLYHYSQSSLTGATRSLLFGYNDRENRLDRALQRYTATTSFNAL